MCYDKFLFTDYQSIASVHTAEMADDGILNVIKTGSIRFELKINDKKMMNIIIDVEHVSDLNYNLIFTNKLKRKSCKIVVDDDRLNIIDKNDNEVFMSETFQSETEGNFCTLNFWHSHKMKATKIFTF